MYVNRAKSGALASYLLALGFSAHGCAIVAPSEIPAATLAVTSYAPTINTSQATILTATGRSAEGLDTPVRVAWSATGGALVPLSDSTAQFTATSAGDYLVSAKATSAPFPEAATTISVIPLIAPTVGVTLTPASATLNTGGSVLFSAVGNRQDGTTFVPPITYTATGGTVTTDGLYMAGSQSGTYRVIASIQNGAFADTSVVTIAPATLQAVFLTPTSVSLSSGEEQTFSVTGQWSNGSSTAPTVSFSATGGSITMGGRFTAGATAGTYSVIATQLGGALADTSTVTVTPPVLQAVVLNPPNVNLLTGATMQFSVSGQWSNGSTAAPAVTFSATGGTITAGGLYTAGTTAGTFRVIATQQGGALADTSTIIVTPPGLQAVILTPATTSVTAGLTQQFTVSGVWNNGATTAPAVTYSATGGTITAGGLYTAGATAGTFRVIATQLGGSLSDTSIVTIVPPILQSVVLTPATTSVTAGLTQQFTVSGVWNNGATTAPAVTYSATGGTITAGGLYTAGATAGTFRVIATQQGGTLADTSTVTITAPVLQQVILTPATATLVSATTRQFTVSGVWNNGATTAPTVTYSATGGTITAGGLYTAGATAGTFRVIATQQGGTLADTSTVTITAPVLQQVVLTPATATLAPGATQQFTVSGVWNNGATTAPTVTYSVTGGTITAGGLYTAGATAGFYRVIATQQGGTLADTSTISIASSTPPTPGSNPNEPTGMTVGFNESFTNSPVGQGVTGWFVETGSSNVSIVDDATAPVSGPKVLQLKFPSGFGGGNAPMVINWNETNGMPANTGTLYMRMRLKISADWSNNGNGGTKFIWPRAGTATNHFAPLNFYNDEIRSGFSLQGAYLNGVDKDYIEPGSHSRGAWHDLEWLITQGSSGGASDGTVKLWVDGVLVLNETGIKMLPNGQALGWTWLAIEPTFGYGSNPVPRNQYIWIDHFYASVK